MARQQPLNSGKEVRRSRADALIDAMAECGQFTSRLTGREAHEYMRRALSRDVAMDYEGYYVDRVTWYERRIAIAKEIIDRRERG